MEDALLLSEELDDPTTEYLIERALDEAKSAAIPAPANDKLPMIKMCKLFTILISLLALLASNNTGKAAGEVDWPKLRMAKTVLTYVERCENRSVPGYYVDKATTIWKAATSSAQKIVTDEIAQLLKEYDGKGTELCQTLGPVVRIIVASDFNPPSNVPVQPVQPPVDTSKLSAKITRIENSGGGYVYPLIVVDNQSDTPYETTRWSCTFFQNDDPVHEDTFLVRQVAPKGKTAHKGITHTSASFTSTSCRLLSAR